MGRPPMRRAMIPPPPPRRARGKFWLYFLLISVTMIAVAFPTIIVVGIAMLPAMASWITDRTDQKYGFFCIGGLNFAGMFPYLMDLWSGNHNITGALNIVTDVFALAVMYGAAMAGWMVYTVIPPVITSFMTVLTERRLSALRANQRRIVDEWGDEVTLGIRAPGNGPATPAPRPGAPSSSGGPGGGVQAAMAAMEAIEAKEEADGDAPMGTAQ
tara:strand:+ start:104 stop:745 length:642 start_codon:yes stop_codon:yes gene_type:complete